ncbi:MAG TPA: nuclear transport factor 2 family protein [Lentimicrobium sp.]|jgi:ketosteroid isomerase-like protein|nr:nuclear transport factor 2 family protein [Lentimicrobium sp.]
MKRLAWYAALLLLFASACNSNPAVKAPDPSAEKEAIKLALQKYVIANETQNIAMIADLWANDSTVFSIGTDRRDVLEGFEAVKSTFSGQFERFEDTFIAARDLRIYVHPSCEAAWFSQVLQYNFTIGDTGYEYPDLRFTGFLEKRDGKWVILQTHLSKPAN